MSTPSVPAPGEAAASGIGERPARAGQILAQCWPVLAEVLLPRIPEILQSALAAAARGEEEALVRAAGALQPQTTAVLQSYALALRGAFDGASEQFFAPRAAAPPARRAVLSLQELDESDQRSQFEQVSARLRNLVQVPQAALLTRLQTLAGNPDVTDAQSPLRPAIFLQAMLDSLAPFVASPAGLLRYFAVPLAPVLEAAYRAVNDFLDLNNIQPYVPARLGGGARSAARGDAPALSIEGDAPPAADGAKAESTPGPSSAARTASTVRPNTEPEPPAGDEAALAEYVRLQALLGINAQILLDAAAAALGKAPGAAPPPLVAPAEALLAFMLSAQRRDAARVAATREDAGKGAEGAGAAPLADMVGTREHSRHLITLAASPLHKLTIQLVARVFARIERDRLVPEPLRTLLVCLRFPALEVALADPALLLRGPHPLRRLLDAIGTSSIGWSADGPESRRYLHHVRAAVHFVVHSPGSAASAFAQSCEQFDAFLASVVPPQSEAKTLAKDALREADRREMQAQDVARFIEELLRGTVLEEYLHEFLIGVWSRVLVAGAARDAEEPGLFARLANVMPDLVASVQLPAAADRKRLVDTIPTLLLQLRDGVALIGWPPEKLQAFLNRLMIAHSQGITGGDLPPAAFGTFSASTMRIRLDGLRLAEPVVAEREGRVPVLEEAVHFLLQQRGAGVIHQWIKHPPAVPTEAIGEAEAAHQIAQWRDRSWFDMRLGRTLVRMRLAWWAPSRSLALFTSRSGGSLVSFSYATLLTYRRFGWIAPAEPVRLLSRALGSVLSDLRRAVQAAAQGGTDGA